MITPASLSQLTFMATYGRSHRTISKRRQKKLNLIYRGVISVYQCKQKMDSGYITAILKVALQDNSGWKSSWWVKAQVRHPVIHYVGKEKWPMVWSAAQGPGRRRTGRLEPWRPRVETCGWTYGTRPQVWRFLCYILTHTRKHPPWNRPQSPNRYNDSLVDVIGH